MPTYFLLPLLGDTCSFPACSQMYAVGYPCLHTMLAGLSSEKVMTWIYRCLLETSLNWMTFYTGSFLRAPSRFRYNVVSLLVKITKVLHHHRSGASRNERVYPALTLHVSSLTTTPEFIQQNPIYNYHFLQTISITSGPPLCARSTT